MKFKTVANRVSRAYVICQFLASLAMRVGPENYRLNLVRLEHGVGTGFFGVSNTGSSDCAKECFRGITDSLDQTNRNWEGIDFRTEACKNLTNANFRELHRVEHTYGIAKLFHAFEEQYIIKPVESGSYNEDTFTANELAKFVIENQIVCLILQKEQLSHGAMNEMKPFSRYSSSIFFKNRNISDLSKDEIIEVNSIERYKTLLKDLKDFDFTDLNEKNRIKLFLKDKAHKLPPLDLAVEFGNSEFDLLKRHYNHKCEKRTNPKDARWYNAADAARYASWLVTQDIA